MASSSAARKSTRLDPRSSTVKALFALSRGYCYAPGCTNRVVRMHGKVPIIVVEIAHVVAASDGGPRADKSMTEEKRREFANLILLCGYHHEVVDGEETRDEYTIKVLTKWKAARESELGVDLSPLNGVLNEDNLESALKATVTSVVIQTKTEVLGAVERLEELGQESVRLLRTLVEEVFDRPYIDLDAVASLAASAQLLEHLPATAGVLQETSRSLSHLPDSADTLSSSSSRLISTTDYIGMLSTAVHCMPDYTERLHSVLLPLRDLPDHTGSLVYFANSFTEARESISDSIREIRSCAPDSTYFTNDVDAATARLEKASKTLAQHVKAMEGAAETAIHATTYRPPDRLTYVLRGAVAGAIVATAVMIFIVVMIWPSGSAQP